MRGKAIGFVCRLSAQKSPDLDISASEQSVSTMKQLKAAKNLASNLTARLQIVCCVGHAYQPHLPITVHMLSAHVQKNWSGIGRYDAAQAHRVCTPESSS